MPDTDEETLYTSPFRSWYSKASVRSAPRRQFDVADENAKYYFPPQHVPIASHPLVKALPPALYQEVLIQHLYRYQDFTAKLEHLVVNRTALAIAHGTTGLHLPEAMRMDAYKVYCDEAYHALFSADVIAQVQAHTSVRPLLPDTPYFLRRLLQIQQEQPPHLRDLTGLLFVIVSETLISGSLTEIPDDPDVAPIVRDVIRDHAGDEGRHHTYFVHFLRHLWAQLDPEQRKQAGRLVPRLISTFLDPDLDAINEELLGYRIARDAAEQIIAETFTDEVVRTARANMARQTVRHFVSLDVLDDAAAEEEFNRNGLLTAQPTTATR
ncbi:diiron oxygenase [Streptomyces rubiginosohelvolus]|uniref:diiron oxygenase n=1 Tax=Streptomyces rubiginosohelvolus TaxID=67362 RepID=UPI0035DED5FD